MALWVLWFFPAWSSACVLGLGLWLAGASSNDPAGLAHRGSGGIPGVEWGVYRPDAVQSPGGARDRFTRL